MIAEDSNLETGRRREGKIGRKRDKLENGVPGMNVRYRRGSRETWRRERISTGLGWAGLDWVLPAKKAASECAVLLRMRNEYFAMYGPARHQVLALPSTRQLPTCGQDSVGSRYPVSSDSSSTPALAACSLRRMDELDRRNDRFIQRG
ncbi:hypothetical protein LY78DRAFT_183425 [Colletotrichum sublineola]|nr:hypothetical protein LY78DRAFT_183425 [Colletotrichum sublineola]